MAKRSKSSHKWLQEHFSDEFVKKAQAEGWRSRAAFKLQEIDDKDRLLKPGKVVVDLGAAPGGWSQYAARKLKGKGRVIALDILPMDALADVEILTGDFREETVYEELITLLGAGERRMVDLVMSDMAPNLSGNRAVDQPRGIYLCELALELAAQTLKPGGTCLMKVFQGEGFDALLADARAQYSRVVMRKPKSSRARSSEVYMLATGYTG